MEAGQALGATSVHVLDLFLAAEASENAVVLVGIQESAFTQFSIPPSSEKELALVSLFEDLAQVRQDVVFVVATAHVHTPDGDTGVSDAQVAGGEAGVLVLAPPVKELVTRETPLILVADLHPAFHTRDARGHGDGPVVIAAGPAVEGALKEERLKGE